MGAFPSTSTEKDAVLLKSSNLNSYLTSLPPLFQMIECNSRISDTDKKKNGDAKKSLISKHWLCAVQPNEKEKHISFTITDGGSVFFKAVPLDELREMKNALEKGEVSIPWWQFFTSLLQAFKKNKTELTFVVQNQMEIARLSLDLFLSTTLGKSTITLNLRLMNESNSSIIIRESYLSPLFLIYRTKTSRNTLKTNQSGENEDENYLQSQLKMEREKNHALQQELQQLRKNQHNSNLMLRNAHSLVSVHSHSTSSLHSPSNNVDDDILFPGEALQRFIKNFKHKLIESRILSSKQMEDFESTASILSKTGSLLATDEAVNEKEKGAISLIKERYSKRKKKHANKPEVEQVETKIPATIDTDIKATESLTTILDQIDKWNFDIFALDALSEGHALLLCGYTLFVKNDLINKLRIPEDTLINALRVFESNYHANPYHNCIHASDVTQVIHVILKKGNLNQYLTTEDIFAALFASLIHDLDHPGMNNSFQVNTQSYLATLYNDRSILENHHVAFALELTRLKQFNIFCNLNVTQFRDVRETIIGMVLATDMSNHTKYVNKFRQRLEADADFTMKEDIRLALQIAIKLADVSNPTRPLNLYLIWTEKIMEEFFNQGDIEKEMGFNVIPLMDRKAAQIGRGQQAFINFVVQPMFQLVTLLLPKMKFAEEYIAENLKYWNTHDSI